MDLVCSGSCFNIKSLCMQTCIACYYYMCLPAYDLTKDSLWVSLIMPSGTWKLTSVRVKVTLGEFTCMWPPLPLKKNVLWHQSKCIFVCKFWNLSPFWPKAQFINSSYKFTYIFLKFVERLWYCWCFLFAHIYTPSWHCT